MKHALTLGLAILASTLATPSYALDKEIVQAAPNLSSQVAKRAVAALKCTESFGGDPSMLIVVDMSEPSSSRRLWAFNLDDDEPTLVVNDFVAHGAGSDPSFTGRPKTFGNVLDSRMTSLGLYQVGEQYTGKNGLSRRLDGLMRGWNDQARHRDVVMHPSNYVREGAVGRSFGCPAVRHEVIALLEQHGLGNAMLWIDGPDTALHKAIANCKSGWDKDKVVAKIKPVLLPPVIVTAPIDWRASMRAFTRSCNEADTYWVG